MSFFGERVSDAYGLGLGLEFFKKVLTTTLQFVHHSVPYRSKF